MELREYRKATRCEHGGRLLRCRRTLLGQCQYCARGFCARHGKVYDDGQEICVQKRCELLRVDVERHLVFKAEARARNAAGTCGEDGCPESPATRCDRCVCRYCAEHMKQVILTIPRGGELTTEAQLICDHCRARLPLWSEE